MTTFLFDGSFEGLLSAVHFSIKASIIPEKLNRDNEYQGDLFSSEYKIKTNEKIAKNIWNSFSSNISDRVKEMTHRAFLSCLTDIDYKVFLYIRITITNEAIKEDNYRNEINLDLKNIEKRVLKDALRVIQFVRFRETKDNIYFAPVEPDFDVIKLTAGFFKNRFADQQWLIYDTKREYGIFYNKKEVNIIKLHTTAINDQTGQIDKNILSEKEEKYEKLWKNYYKATTTHERMNIKLHMQFLPKKLWKYLPEKDIS